MTYRQLIAHYGTQRNIAEALDVTIGAVSQWCVANTVPMLRQYQLEVLTRGKLRADKP